MKDFETPGLERWRRATDAPLLVLAIGTLPLLLLELIRDDLPSGDRFFIDAMNVVLLVAFSVDYVVEFVLARPKSRYVRGERTSLVIVVAQALAVFSTVPAAGVFRILRVGRAGRAVTVLARLLAIGGVAAGERQVLRRHAASFALGVAGLTWITSAVAFTLIEDVGVGGREHLGSFFDALWWSATTMTTVGYGDLAPVTAAGRVVAVVTMLVGISAFAVVTAKIAELLVRTAPEE